MPPNPTVQPGGPIPEAVRRGRLIFESPQTGCATCHPAPFYTDRRKHDVGTADGPDEAAGKVLMDRMTGEAPVASYWNPTVIVSDNRIPVRETDVSTYEFQAPPSGTTVNVEARLIFRRAFKGLMEAKGWGVADILMEVETTSLVVP